MLNQFAIVVSIGLQYGVPLDAFVKSFTFQNSNPAEWLSVGLGESECQRVSWTIFSESWPLNISEETILHTCLKKILEATSISRPVPTDDGLLRHQGEKREVQMTLTSSTVEPIEDELTKTRRLARERGFRGYLR